MLTTRPRRSTSAVSYSEAEATQLLTELDKLKVVLLPEELENGIDSASRGIEVAHTIRHLFTEHKNPNHLRDAFRNLDGFQIILELLRRASKALESAKFEVNDVILLLAFVQQQLSLLTAAFQEHWGNRKYFKKRVEDGGWSSIHDIFEGILKKSPNFRSDAGRCRERLFGMLLSCSLEDESLNETFLILGRDTSQARDRIMTNTTEARKRISALVGKRPYLHSPEVFVMLLDLWHTSSRDSTHFDGTTLYTLKLLQIITQSSTNNLLSAHEAGLLSTALPLLLDTSLHNNDLDDIQNLSQTLLKLGVSKIDDARLLYGKATSNIRVSKVLHQALSVPPSPPFLHFDLTQCGHASAELPDLGRTFPPTSSSAGYTLSIWLQVLSFDKDSHTTLFGAFDSSQTCFVLVYIEKDTQHLILQTSVTSSRPSVRFKSFTFQPSRWYHLCIVHRRPKTTSSSRAYLFIDGEFMEHVKAHYPAAPPLAPYPTPADPGAKRPKPVQAFFGTPQDLATRLGPGVVSSQWQLASACLFNDALSDDLIAVHKELGPRYHGNYQDCLGSFQTYRASAALNIRNENLHAGKEESSEIIAAIRSKASLLLPEHKFLLNISPMMVLDDNDHNNVDESQLIKALSKTAAKNLRDATRGGRTPIVVNGAISSINTALLHLSGIAVLTGEPAVVVPQSLDDAAWRIGGCAPVGLSLLNAAQTKEQILVALDILFATVQNSWRNSEAMERDNGFGVLANLLGAKLSKQAGNRLGLANNNDDDTLSFDVLTKILNFVGYNVEQPEDSVCNNPLAYRILLVDMDIWRSASPRVQKLYFDQFSTFAIGSKYHLFNARRLSRMRITKKWLEALKGDVFYVDTIGGFMSAFKTLLGNPVPAETMRLISLYITYAIHKQTDKTTATSRSRSIRKSPSHTMLAMRRSTTPSPNPDGDVEGQSPLTRAEVGMKVLELYADMLCQGDTNNIRKFARAVTSKWLLHLLADDNPRTVISTLRILARLLTVNGPSYIEKFCSKTGGFAILRHRLRRWWNITEIWTLSFAILFGKDVAEVDLSKSFDLFGLMTHFPPMDSKVTCSHMFPVIVTMLQNGLNHITRRQSDPNSPTLKPQDNDKLLSLGDQLHSRGRSVSLQDSSSSKNGADKSSALFLSVKIIQTVARFLGDMQSNCQSFKDSTTNTSYVQELLFLLYPVVVSSDIVNPETELHSRDAALTFNGQDVVIRPLSSGGKKPAPIVRTATVEGADSSIAPKTKSLRRGSSYVLVTSEESQFHPSPARLEAVGSPKDRPEVSINVSHGLIQDVLEMVISVFSDQVFSRKDFQGIGLFMKVPPGFQEHQAYFESFILRNTISSLSNAIKLDRKLLWETRVLTNLGRFCSHLDEAVYEGWFIDGADVVLDFLGDLLEYLQTPEIRQIKSVRLCSEILGSLRFIVFRIALLKLSDYDPTPKEKQTVAFLKKLAYWQTILFSSDGPKDEFFKLLCYLLYTKLVSSEASVRDAAATMWRIVLVQKPDEAGKLLQQMDSSETAPLLGGLQKVLELDNESFLSWVDDHRHELDAIFFGKLISNWENFVSTENRLTQESYKARIQKRREKLKTWMREDLTREDVIRRHEISAEQFSSNIYFSEHLKRQRALQDTHDNQVFNILSWTKMMSQLHRPCGLLENTSEPKWQLDLTEGRNRMRLRVIPDQKGHLYKYEAKSAASTKALKAKKSMLEIRTKTLGGLGSPIAASPTHMTHEHPGSAKSITSAPVQDDEIEGEDEFEIVDEPEPGREDKNRKVMRSLQRGDQVEQVHNISRIVGLEACEGLLIVGKNAMYLLDHFFQRSDGEIVDAWEAPPEERDSYLQLISGDTIGTPTTKPTNAAHETRSWRWEDILSISKRRFLFRDVAIEVFFVDGQSYLLTITTPKLRDELYAKLLSRAPHVAGSTATSLEDQWRLESLRTSEDAPQTIGSRFTSVFAQTVANPATRKWMKGEMSNFHYLMLVNTMAGRTYNDLTQYPVFPWVLADYTSEELDLTNPRTFRDLTKPMGCQTPERQYEFRERYQSFAEMGDHNAPPFHYGTHYSSAMIVTSFLIRLQPFVQSYLLLQGGSFDHPDRLFYSIEKTWNSASRDNMTDVRELIPEFYYLPEMLTNSNGYDFGSRQGDGGTIDDVGLPPWAKGDPKIFIAKHREALESDYVSAHLHQWIDLVFGHKQRGDAALEATNVFHHLSYRGARNLDEIDDPVERRATIGIIHNFGQTPNQVFQRHHPAREDPRHRAQKMDTLAETLTRLPFPLLESPDRIATLTYSQKNGHLLCSGGFRINIPPDYDKYLEWGFVDGSVRFFNTSDNKLLGLFEHMHQGQLSAAIFADSRTLITAGTDCTISVWAVITTSRSVDITPKGCLFGHSAAVTTLSVARSFATLLSASSDGFVALWDLNRLEIVRTISINGPIECARVNDVTGTIMICSGSLVHLYTLNGDLLLSQNVCIVEGDDVVTSCDFYEGSGTEFFKHELIFTGHRRGTVNIWNLTIINGKFTLEHVKRMVHTDGTGIASSASITAVLPLAHAVYTGDDDGHVYEWDCIQRHDTR